MTCTKSVSVQVGDVLVRMIRGADIEVGGKIVEVDTSGYAPNEGIVIQRQGLFFNIHLVEENIDIRWDGGKGTMKKYILTI